MRSVEVVIVGQGLAGTAIAWTLHAAGVEIVIIDRNQTNTSSRIAAGLITPITGKKFVKTWQWDAFWPEAVSFYQRIEQKTVSQFFHPIEMVRLFSHATEFETFDRRRSAGDFAGLTLKDDLELHHEILGRYGGFVMSPAARLDTNTYLNVSRDYFLKCKSFEVADLNLSDDDFVIEPDRIILPKLDLSTKRVIFCQGFEATRNPWFRDVPFKPAKGEILSLAIPGLNERRVIHCGVWLARDTTTDNEFLFRAGSTYEWKDLSNATTSAGRDKIVAGLQTFLNKEFLVVAHQAAVRPIHRNQFPVIGYHAKDSRLGFFNGLGSKGSLYAPGCSERLRQYLFDGVVPDRDLNFAAKRSS